MSDLLVDNRMSDLRSLYFAKVYFKICKLMLSLVNNFFKL